MFGEAHAHMMMDGIDYAKAASLHAKGPVDAAIKTHLQAYAEHGITFVRDGGDALGVCSRARELAPAYGIDYRCPVFGIYKQGHYGKIVGRSFENLREYAQLVDDADAAGADFIKIMTTGIMDFDEYGRITGEALAASEVAEMVHIAHEHGLAVMSHTNGKRAVLDAIAAGADSIEHANFIDNECLDAFAQTGTVYVPTATVARSLIGSGHGDSSVLELIWEQSKATIALAFEHEQVVMALGSDGGAVGVLHAKGLEDEHQCFIDACGETSDALDARLAAGDAQVRRTFKRP